MLYQLTPYPLCGLGRSYPCNDHRCSLECRRRWAKREAQLMQAASRQWWAKGGYRLYSVTLKVEQAISTDDHLDIRRRFLDYIRAMGMQFQAVSEIDKQNWIHNHGILIAPSQAKNPVELVKDGWKRAAGELPTRVSMEEVGDLCKWTRYCVKDNGKRTLLFVRAKDNPSRKRFALSWGTRGFYPVSKGKLSETIRDANWLRRALARQDDDGITWVDIKAALDNIAT